MQTAGGSETLPKILVVDPDDALRGALVEILTEHGYATVEASTASEARQQLESEADIAVALCDIQAPDDVGTGLLATISSDYPELALIVTTGVDDPATAELALTSGAYGFVQKPFSRNEILVNLASALRRQQVEATRVNHIRSLERKVTRMLALGQIREGLGGGGEPGWMSQEETITRLSRAVSIRDEETGSHIERMSRYSAMLAQKVGFSGASAEDVRMASALHDAGKIGIPDGILLKPGPLDAEEYAIMQRHAQIGYRLLAGSASPLIELGAIVALNHHERWDGAGYPRGLRDGEIPEIARIAAVCDVFDALTSNRVYRPAMPFEKAIEIMIDLRGRHFEARLCDAFLDSMDDVRAIRNDFPDPRGEDIRVLIVDDHEMFAESMIRLLVSHGGIKVVARAGSRAEARKLATAHEPDVILMDYELPDGTGATTTEEIKLLMPSAKIVMLTGRTDDEVLVRAITAGCSGFVTKQEAAEKVVHAIRSVHAGEALVSLERLPALLEQLRPTHRGLGAALTPREVEVLRLVAQGRSNKDIAGELGLSRHTLRNHVQSILDKLQAPSKLQAVATAAREGILVGSAIDPEGHSGDRPPGHNGQGP